MKLTHLLLGLIAEHPRTGYELLQYFHNDGRFLRSNTTMSQVYRSLAQLADDELVRYEIDHRPGAQDAKLYSVTPEGFTVFLDWLTSDYQPTSRFQDPEFTVRLSFAGFLSKAAVRELIAIERAARLEQVAKFRYRDRRIDIADDYPFDRELASTVSELMHQGGAQQVDLHLAWLEELAAALGD